MKHPVLCALDQIIMKHPVLCALYTVTVMNDNSDICICIYQQPPYILPVPSVPLWLSLSYQKLVLAILKLLVE